MNSKTVILFFIALSLAGSTVAQVIITAVGQRFQIMPAVLPDYHTLDTTYLTVQYRYTYPCDNFKDGYELLEDDITLQVAPKKSKTFSRNLLMLDRNVTFKENNPVKFRLDYNDFEVYNLADESQIITNRRVPYSRLLQPSTQVIEYREKLPAIKWTQMESCDTIAGYPCLKATACVFGRNWTVWYTAEIPVIANLWKFNNLPGLILCAEDESKMFRFECTSINAAKEPVCFYEWRPVKMQKSKWLRMEEKMHSNPKDFFLMNGEIGVINMHTREKMDGNEWHVRYCPLDME